LRDLEHPLTPACPGALLLLVRHARRQRNHVPMDVRAALVGTERVELHPLGADLLPHHLADPVEEPLKVQVLLHREVGRESP
jgi:hypothetical protein